MAIAIAGPLSIAAAQEDPELRRVFEQILQDPGNPGLNFRYARLATDKGDIRKALAAYERILAQDPNNEEAKAAIRRIQRDPRVALSVEEPVGVVEAWVTIEGTAAIEETGGYELAARLAQRYYDEPRRSRALARWFEERGNFVVIRITPTRIRSGG